jgi:hypothetical protein
LWKSFRAQAERDSGIWLKLFGFIPESVFTLYGFLSTPLAQAESSFWRPFLYPLQNAYLDRPSKKEDWN